MLRARLVVVVVGGLNQHHLSIVLHLEEVLILRGKFLIFNVAFATSTSYVLIASLGTLAKNTAPSKGSL